MVKALLEDRYGLIVNSAERSSVGAGSELYFVNCAEGRYVVKFPSENEMNNIESEIKLCSFLLENNISACRFVRNTDGDYLTHDRTGRIFHVQKFIDGMVYDWNTAPEWLMTHSAEMLGRIHLALENYSGLNVGIGESFFGFMTPENASESYKRSLKTAITIGDVRNADDLYYRLELMKRFPKYCFDMKKLSCKATHGDFFISQLICGDKKINAVIDWTSACVHPVVWEIMRSYVYASPECAHGVIDIEKISEYFKAYMSVSKLNAYDLEKAAELFYYQLAVCDYYGQYYGSSAINRDFFMRQAQLSTVMLKWFEKNIDRLTEKLIKLI